MNRTVLVVEDDPWTRDVLELALESEGYGVELAVDGLDALDRLEAGRPSLIVLDLMMPHMNGFEFAEQLRLRGHRPGIPILVLTAAGRAGLKAETIGADGYLEKPFDVPTLLDEVARLAAA
jgi:two-component system response regulator MprA